MGNFMIDHDRTSVAGARDDALPTDARGYVLFAE
jgi:hypothetical protein